MLHTHLFVLEVAGFSLLRIQLYSLCCCRDTAEDDSAVDKHNADKVGGVFLL